MVPGSSVVFGRTVCYSDYMRMKKVAKIVGVFGIFVIVIGAVLLISKSATEKPLPAPYEPPTFGEPTTKLSQQNKKVLESENRQVYRSKEYGFEIQYPPSWTLREYGNGVVGFFLSEPETLFKYTGDILILVYDNPENLPVDEFLLKKFSVGGLADGYTKMPITINGEQWFWESFYQRFYAEISREGYYYLIQTKNNPFPEKNFKDFLSRITFFKPTRTKKHTTTSSTIIDRACGYKITLPPNWIFEKGSQCHELERYGTLGDRFISPQNQSLYLNVYGTNFSETKQDWLDALERVDIEVTEFTIDGYRALRFPPDME